MDYVSEEAVAQAKGMERKFQLLKPEAGVIFVSVRAVPTTDGRCRYFEVRLGMTKRIGESTGRSLVKHVLDEEIDSGLTILANVYSGICGAAHDAGDEEVGQS